MSNRKFATRFALFLCLTAACALVGAAQTSNFTYQGKFTDAGQPANGQYDLQFKLYDQLAGGTQQGNDVTVEDVVVVSGVFTVQLNFGLCPTCFNGAARWLEIAVRPGASVGAFTVLAPRQPVQSTPYAIQSLNAQTAVNLSGPLAGDVTGTQGTTTVARLQGQTLAGTAPTAGQVLKFNGISNQWEPGTDNNSGGTVTNVTASTPLASSGGVTPNVSLTGTVPLANGGTNATTAAAARTNLGAAAGGANSDITSLSGLTTPLSVGQGGTGLSATGVAGNYLRSNGTNWTSAQLQAADLPTGSSNYIQNSVAQQAASNFNISGTGTAATFNATTFNGTTVNGTNVNGSTVNATSQYNLNGARILDANLSSNLFVGLNAGAVNSGGNNTFVGHNAGTANTTATNNTFVGYIAGQTNQTGDLNTFIGSNAGRDNTTGTQNTFIGTTAGLLNNIGNFNTFVGRNAGHDNVNGSDNAFFGDDAGTHNATGIQNAYFGSFAGTNGNVGDNNTFIGFRAGNTNVTGGNNTTLGGFADVAANNLNNATAIGYRAAVNASNALVLGGVNGVNGAASNTNVGIGTTTPTFRLHVRAGAQNGIKIQNDGTGDFQQIRWTDSADAFKAAISVGPVGSEDMRFFVNGGDRMIIENTGTVILNTLGTAGSNSLCRNASNQIASCSSSLRYKNNVRSYTKGLNLLNQLRPISFKWKANNQADLGLAAEEVAAVDPLLATYNERGEVEGVKYSQLTIVLINAVKEQQAQIEALRKQVADLQKRLPQKRPRTTRARKTNGN